MPVWLDIYAKETGILIDERICKSDLEMNIVNLWYHILHKKKYECIMYSITNELILS